LDAGPHDETCASFVLNRQSPRSKAYQGQVEDALEPEEEEPEEPVELDPDDAEPLLVDEEELEESEGFEAVSDPLVLSEAADFL